MCLTLGGTTSRDRAHHETLEACAEAAAALLNYATRDHGGTPSGFAFYESRTTLPTFLAAATNAIIQRRERPVTQKISGIGPFPTFALSEVHLSHGVTIRGAEKVNQYCHDSLSGIWGPLEPKAPLLSVSSGQEPAFEAVLDRFVMDLADNPCEALTHFANLCFLELPRWAPSQLRYLPLIGHEHVHRITWLADIVDTMFDAREQEFVSRLTPAQSTGNSVNDVFGVELNRFSNGRRRLVEAVMEYVTDIASDWLPEGNTANSSAEFNTPDLEVKNLSIQHADELLCDATAVLLFGPAYVYASALGMPSEPAHGIHIEPSGKHFYLRTHPPSLARHVLQRMVLEMMGFVDSARALEDQLSTKEWIAAAPLAVREYCNFVASSALRDRTMSLIKLFARLVQTSGSTSTTHLAGDSLLALRDTILLDESDWRERWETLRAQVFEGDVFPDSVGQSTPADVLNAMWLRGTDDGVAESRSRISWRIALKNCWSEEPL